MIYIAAMIYLFIALAVYGYLVRVAISDSPKIFYRLESPPHIPEWLILLAFALLWPAWIFTVRIRIKRRRD